MPELPEVEDARRKLTRWMRGATIVSARAFDKVIMRPRAPATLARDLRGRRVERIERRGKWLRIVLSDDALLFSHLGMTGDWRRAAPDEEVRFERARFDIEKNGKRSRVSYADMRKFGRLIFAHEDIPSWSALGPDPLEHRRGTWLAKQLTAKLGRRGKRSIKEALMDQTVLAGVGNIYATEALWKAKIDPRSPAGALSLKDVSAVVRGLVWTFELSLADLGQRGGGADDPFVVYGHKGQPCPRCKTTLERVTLGGRTTTYCPGCQERLARK